MDGRNVFRALAFVLVLVIVGALGVAAYNAGLTAGLNQVVVPEGQPVVVAPYGYGPHWHGGFGFFGILLWIIGFFLIIGLLRAAFGLGRGGGKWGHYAGPGGYYGRDRVADWHRELHRREESGESSSESNRPTAGS